MANRIGTYSAGTSGFPVLLQWFTGLATEPANPATAYLADRSTEEKALAGVTDVRTAAWLPDPAASYPLAWVQVRVEAREAGHAFTVHGSVSGVPQQTIRVTAKASTPNAILSFVLSTGMEFWFTREAEDGTASQPSAPATGFWSAMPNASILGLSFFSEVPVRAGGLVARNFRINARTRTNHTFTIRQSDGYSATFGPVAAGPTLAYAPGQIAGSNPLPIYTFSALLAPTTMVTLQDDTNGSLLSVSPGLGSVDWLDGWKSAQPVSATSCLDRTDTVGLPSHGLIPAAASRAG